MPKLMDLTVVDVVPQDPCAKCCCCCTSVVGLVAFILFVPCMVWQVDRLHWGLEKNKVTGQVKLDKVYDPGRYWVGFWSEFIMFPQYLQTIEFSNDKPEKNVKHLSTLRTRDKDGKQIWLDVSVQYRLLGSKIGEIYKNYQMQYEDIYISELRDVLNKELNKFKVEEVWENYAGPSKALKEVCVEVLKKRNAECWDLQLWGVRLEKVYEDQLVRTQVQKQAKLTESARSKAANTRADTEVELAAYKKEITIVQEDGAAKKFKIERNASAFAEQRISDAKADVVQIIKETVVPSAGARIMTGSELTTYMKLMQLETMPTAPMLYHPNGKEGADGVAGWSRKLGDATTATRAGEL